MSFTPEKIPTTKDELNFKVVETYCDLLDKHEKGLITNAQLDCAIRTLIAAVGWALPKETFLMLSDANVEIDDSFAIMRFFSDDAANDGVIKSFMGRGVIEFWFNGELKKSFECGNPEDQIKLLETLTLGIFKKYNLKRVK